jgi:hypothetical protein
VDTDHTLQALARLVLHVERTQNLVTAHKLQAVAAAWGLPSAISELDSILTTGVDELVLFTDLRTAYDRVTGAFTPVRVYRVNPRHPIVVGALGDGQ